MALLKDKVCVITGGAGSVGLASARLFLEEGAKVMLVDLTDAALKRATGNLSGNVTSIAADVTRADSTRAYIDATVAKCGKIDVLFSNAGNPGASAPLAAYPEDVFDHTMAVHVRGAFLACKYGLPQMNDGGSIIVTSSVAGIRAGGAGNISYITAKHAQVGLMRVVAKAAAPRGIRVNSLHPGPIDNEFQTNIEQAMGKMMGIDATAMFNQMIPLKRHAKPEEVARSALYLASDMSSFVTGTTLLVDGGMAG